MVLAFMMAWIAGAAEIQNSPNAMYVKTLSRKPFQWESQGRVPLLLTEPVGLDRRNYPMNVALELPGRFAPESIRVATPQGKVIPCQVTAEASGNKVELSFSLDIPADFQLPLFVYYGVKESGANVPEYPVQLRETDDSFVLYNNLFEVDIIKNAIYNGGLIRGLKAHTQSDSQLSCQYNHFCWQSFRGIVDPGTPAKIGENGPIRKSIFFDDGKNRVEFTVFSGSPIVYYTISGKGQFTYTIGFTPGGDLLEDDLYYSSTKGPKRLPLYWQMPDDSKQYELRPYMQEGWLAFYDNRKNAMSGVFFDLKNCKIANMSLSGMGYTTTIAGQIPGNEKVSGGLYCADGQFQELRQAYYGWKAPVLVSAGEIQSYSPIKPQTPVFGKDFLRMHTLEIGRTQKMSPNSAQKLIDEVLASGANSIDFVSKMPCFDSTTFPANDDSPQFLRELVKEAHQKGVSVIAGSWPSMYYVAKIPELMKDCYWLSEDGKKQHNGRLSPFLGHDTYVKYAEGLATCDVDGYHILDEFGFWPTSFISRQGREYAKKKYGTECAPLQDWSKINAPEQLTTFRFRVDTVTDLVRDMSSAIRAVKPDAMVFQITSMNNRRLGAFGYQDMEAQNQYLSTANFDLYSTEITHVLFPLKYARAVTGNNKPVFSTTGISQDRPFNRLNTSLHLFGGTNSVLHFAMTGFWTVRGGTAGQLGTTEVYNLLDYTGLEDYLIKCFPIKFLAIFRDRDNFYGELKRGGVRAGKASETDAKVESLVNTLQTIPTDIVVANYFKNGVLKDYKILVIPDNPDISQENALMIKQYVEEGGVAIIEGGVLNNAEIQKLCGIESNGPAQAEKFTIQPGSDALPISGEIMRYPIKCAAAKTLLAFTDGTPAVTVNQSGKGKAIYLAPVLSGKANSDAAVAELFSTLVRNNAPSLPLATNANIWSNVFTDSENYLISLYNPGPETKSVEIVLGDCFPKDKTALVGFNRGEKIPLNNGKVQLSLEPEVVNFYLLVDDSYRLPELKKTDENYLARSTSPEYAPYRKLELKSSQAKKLKKKPGIIYVGIFKPEEEKKVGLLGAEAIFRRVKELEQVEAHYLPNMEEQTIADFDVVIVPDIGFKSPGNLNKGWEDELRQFAAKGGGVMLVHHSVGYGKDSNASKLFPSIAAGKDWVQITGMLVENENHPVIDASSYRNKFPQKSQDPAFAHIFREPAMNKGEHLKSGFPDYIQLQPGANAIILVKSEFEAGRGGDVTVVAGQYEKGRVVISGMNIGADVQVKDGKVTTANEKLSKIENNILVNSIYWLGEGK